MELVNSSLLRLTYSLRNIVHVMCWLDQLNEEHEFRSGYQSQSQVT